MFGEKKKHLQRLQMANEVLKLVGSIYNDRLELLIKEIDNLSLDLSKMVITNNRSDYLSKISEIVQDCHDVVTHYNSIRDSIDISRFGCEHEYQSLITNYLKRFIQGKLGSARKSYSGYPYFTEEYSLDHHLHDTWTKYKRAKARLNLLDNQLTQFEKALRKIDTLLYARLIPSRTPDEFIEVGTISLIIHCPPWIRDDKGDPLDNFDK